MTAGCGTSAGVWTKVVRLSSVLFATLPFLSFAGRTAGFSMSAFNTVVSASSASAVFSPLSFELDCALISEAFGPVEKAAYVEALGALVGYDSVYRPILENYAESATNGFSLVSARAFLVPSLRFVTPRYRSFVQSEYRAQVCPVRPAADGAESFLRAAMDGEMEDFSVPGDVLVSRGASFCDLESFRCSWAEPFPRDNTCRRDFTAANGDRRPVEMMSDVRSADVWTTERFSMLRLPMTGGAWFFAVLPAEGVPLAAVRGDFAAEKFDDAMVVFRAAADPSVYHGMVSVGLPKFAVDTVVDLKPAFLSFSLPIGGFKEIFPGQEAVLCSVGQRTRFVLDERGPGGTEAVAVPCGGGSARKFVCDRPFLFFVYHEPTRTVPVAGIFAGGAS